LLNGCKNLLVIGCQNIMIQLLMTIYNDD